MVGDVDADIVCRCTTCSDMMTCSVSICSSLVTTFRMAFAYSLQTSITRCTDFADTPPHCGGDTRSENITGKRERGTHGRAASVSTIQEAAMVGDVDADIVCRCTTCSDMMTCSVSICSSLVTTFSMAFAHSLQASITRCNAFADKPPD